MYEDILNKFDEISNQYDSQRKKLIPCFEDFYGISTSIADCKINNPKILDLGAGTGIFSEYLLNKYPNASITLIDISQKMLEISKMRFKNYKNVKIIAHDYLTYVFKEKYDIVISSLSIHHLEQDEKLKIFKKCYLALNKNGIFINSDQFLGETPFIENFNKKSWKDKIEKSGLTQDEIEAYYDRIKLDKEATLSQHLEWFKECGFTDVNCVYKYYHFGVIWGRKTK